MPAPFLLFIYLFFSRLWTLNVLTFMGEKQTNKQTTTTKNQKASNNSGGSSHGAHTPFYLLLFFFTKYKNIFAVSQEDQAGAPCLLGLAAAAMKKGQASVPRTMVSLTGNIPNQNYKCARINKAGVNLKLFYTLFY